MNSRCSTIMSLVLALSSACDVATCARGTRPLETADLATTRSARTVEHQGTEWLVYELDLASTKLRLLGQAPDEPRTFATLRTYLAAQHEHLVLATNAGIFAEDRTAVGLYIAQGRELHPLERKDGDGNFYLKPNGVFWLDSEGAHVAATEHYAPRGAVVLATQSGPLLLEGGAVHPAFTSPGTSLKLRSAIGVDTKGHVWIALSRAPVSFIDSATLFRERLGCADALYLDGEISGVLLPDRVEGVASHRYAGLLVATER